MCTYRDSQGEIHSVNLFRCANLAPFICSVGQQLTVPLPEAVDVQTVDFAARNLSG